MKIQNYKGTRDFYVEDKRLQDYVFAVWSTVCESYGYEQIDAPMLEPLDLYRLKNQASEEIVDEQLYSLTDKGGREIAVRPEMTPSVSRMVAARRQELAYPVRWYSIPNLWRYERPQKGRLREHWQLNVDLFGVEGVDAELELLLVASSIMTKLGASQGMYSIRVNSRLLVNDALNIIGVTGDQAQPMIRLMDRRAKMSDADFTEAAGDILTKEQVRSGVLDKINQVMEATSLSDLPQELRDTAGYKDLQSLLDLATSNGLANAVYDPGIMRGFDYYTGIVFEVFNEDPDNNRSMMGGGRYDGLVGSLGAEPVPTVGFGLGDVTALDFIASNDLSPDLRSSVQIYLVALGPTYPEVLRLATTLRSEGVNVAIDNTGRKIGKCIDSAQKQKIKYVSVIGSDEVEAGKYSVKDIESGEQLSLNEDDLVSMLTT